MGGMGHGWGHVTPCSLRETEGYLGTVLAVLCPAPSPWPAPELPSQGPTPAGKLSSPCCPVQGWPGELAGVGRAVGARAHGRGPVRTVTAAVTGAPGCQVLCRQDLTQLAGAPFPD